MRSPRKGGPARRVSSVFCAISASVLVATAQAQHRSPAATQFLKTHAPAAVLPGSRPEPAVAGRISTLGTSAIQPSGPIERLFNCGSSPCRTLRVPPPFQQRYAPSGFPTLPMMPVMVNGPGSVLMDKSVVDAFYLVHNMTGAHTASISPSGNDKTAVVDDPTHPFLTFNAVVKNSPAQIITAQPGSYTPPDFRKSDKYGNLPKIIVCAQIGTCQMHVPGDEIANSTWTPSSAGDGIYQTQIASDGKTSGAVNNVLYQDGTVDPYGFDARLPQAYPNLWISINSYRTGQTVWNGKTTQIYKALQPSINVPTTNTAYWEPYDLDTAGLENLNQLPVGQYYSKTKHILYVKLNGEDLTDPSVASTLRATYLMPGNNNARMFVYGTVLAVVGFEFDNIGVEDTEYASAGTYTPSEVWEQDDVIWGANFYGNYVLGSTLYAQDVRCHATFYDCFNGNWSAGGVNPDLMVEIDTYNTDAGDSATFDTGILPGVYPNRNGSSSHEGYLASFGSLYEDSVGPEAADTSSTTINVPSISWYVGAIAADWNPANTSNIGGFQMSGVSATSAGDPRNRVFYLDTCLGFSEGGVDVESESNAVGSIYNSQFDAPVKYWHASPLKNYNPSVPPVD